MIKILLSKSIIIKWERNSKSYYTNKGYIFTKMGDEFEISVDDLPLNSHKKIECECDYCGEILIKEYRSFLLQRKTIEKDCCKNCRDIKYKEVILLKYGVEYPLQNDEIMTKMKESNLLKYGKEYIIECEHIRDKVKQTNLKKFGVENVFSSDEIKEKIKQTNLEKFGFYSSMQNKEIVDKGKLTRLNKYGKEYYSQTEECKERIKETSMNNWGVEHPLKSPIIRNRIAQTRLFKYGSILETGYNLIYEKAKKTNLIRYGVEHPLQNDEIMTKVINTLNKNGNCKTSSQQIEIYNYLKHSNYNVELNYPFSRCTIDIALFIDNIKIDIEYDGWYWHNVQRDRKRDEYLKSQGWKILRIRSGHKLPTWDELIEGINKLINTDRNFTQIILDDWKMIDKGVS